MGQIEPGLDNWIIKVNISEGKRRFQLLAHGTSKSLAFYNVGRLIAPDSMFYHSIIKNDLSSNHYFHAPQTAAMITWEFTPENCRRWQNMISGRYSIKDTILEQPKEVKREEKERSGKNNITISPSVNETTGKINSKIKNEKQNTNKFSSHISFLENDHVLYICKGDIVCDRQQHDVRFVTGIIRGADGRIGKIPCVRYCRQCNIYYLRYHDFQYYQKAYHGIFGHFCLKSTGKTMNGSFANMSPVSILRLYGYNVNQVNGLTLTVRHKLLGDLIDYHIISRAEVVRHLEKMVALHHTEANKVEAVRKWKDDLRWVRNYRTSGQRQYVIKKVKEYKGRR